MTDDAENLNDIKVGFSSSRKSLLKSDLEGKFSNQKIKHNI
jgi:hypothetical protein